MAAPLPRRRARVNRFDRPTGGFFPPRQPHPMNKAALIEEVRKLLAGDTTRVAAERATEAVLAAMKRGLKRDGEVAVAGFGTFNVAKLPSRLGFNPHTRRPMRIAALKTVRFRPAAELRTRS